MEQNLLVPFGILTFLCMIVAIDELLAKDKVLGEEWDFLTPYNRRNYWSSYKKDYKHTGRNYV